MVLTPGRTDVPWRMLKGRKGVTRSGSGRRKYRVIKMRMREVERGKGRIPVSMLMVTVILKEASYRADEADDGEREQGERAAAVVPHGEPSTDDEEP